MTKLNFQMYTCPGLCIYRDMDLINEDGWPSLPRINAMLEGTIEEEEANQWGVVVRPF